MARKSHGIFNGDSCIKDNDTLENIRALSAMTIEESNAKVIIDIICEYLKINPPLLDWKAYGRPSNYGRYIFRDRRLIVFPAGRNIDTVLHELAHHVTKERGMIVKHDVLFYNAFREVINIYKTYLT